MAWLDKFVRKADHPMFNAAAAQRLLAELPHDDAFRALDDVTSWMESFKDASGFSLENRIDVAKVLDEAGQPLHEELLHLYLTREHMQDQQGMRLWRAFMTFQKLVAEIYTVCLNEYSSAAKRPERIREQLPVVNARLLRALAEQMKLSLMRYIAVEQVIWDELFRQYLFAEEGQFADTKVSAYPGQAAHSSSRRELLRALALYVAAPAALAPGQIALAYRITGRLAGFFELKEQPDPACPYYVDFTEPAAPELVEDEQQNSPALRFFGASKAIPQLEEIMRQNDRGATEPERRFGTEFTHDGKLTVLKHLLLYWGAEPPSRQQARRKIEAVIKVSHGLDVISKLVPHVNLERVAGLSKNDAHKLHERTGRFNLTAEKIDFTAEDWVVLDISSGGFGALLPKDTGRWVKVGALCGISDQYGSRWWVGMVRRLKTTEQGIKAGVAILSKKPLSVWLRLMRTETDQIANWDSSSGAFKFDYLPAILLPGDDDVAQSTMLMEAHSYLPDRIYEAMTGEKSRHLKLTGLLEEGDDYEQVSFQWLDVGQ